jgi:threonylcarbamoyladenosine tRNA methylthiotransferase MtaB
MKAVVFTLGCKVNSCESDSLLKGLEEIGYEVGTKLEFADLYIINTCAVTAEAENKSRQTISRARKYNNQAKIIVTGCASEKSPEDFSQKENVTLVTGAKSKGLILQMLSDCGQKISDSDNEFEEMFPAKNLYVRAYIKIQDGCNNFCSYCIVPYLRGRSRSRKIENIVKEISVSDAKEIVLTGINISAYNDSGKKLSDLLDSLKNIDKRIRLGSLEANVIDEKLLISAKGLKNFAPHFHLSLQSGSDKVLKDMNRKYTVKEYLDKCVLIRKYFNSAAITTDVISGFPTENEKDFEKTLEVMEKSQFAQAHCFSYSRRTGTKSADLKDLNGALKKDRLEKILIKAETLKNLFIENNIGMTYEVLYEEKKDNLSIGYTGNYIRVYTEGNYDGILRTKLSEKFSDGVKGIILNKE